MPSIRLRGVRLHRLQMKTRFPFRYGIASMTAAPHLFVEATVELDGELTRGLSAEGLPPKWFTKNLDTTFEQDDLPSMLRVIKHAADIGQQLGSQDNFFTWWRQLYDAQHAWADREQIAQLLAGLGVSLIERAVLDAVCRGVGSTLFHALRTNILEIDFASVRPSLKSLIPSDVMPSKPPSSIYLRHTVGLGDPLTSSDVSDIKRPNDGLPLTLEENIARYGLRYFKIKLSGDVDIDRERLIKIASIIGRNVRDDARFTLDANENYETISQFRNAWNDLLDSNELRNFFDRSLLFVEQPVHRLNAIDPDVGDELRSWRDAPPIIIDESDADLESLPTALSLGYHGTSHKNCKGIMKGLLNCATIAACGDRDRKLILSAEDLGNVGPIALLQDLAMVGALGIPHVERNGHHYFAGLSMFPDAIQSDMLVHHSDLYEHQLEFTALAPQDGRLSLKSVNEAPFGLTPFVVMRHFETWEF